MGCLIPTFRGVSWESRWTGNCHWNWKTDLKVAIKKKKKIYLFLLQNTFSRYLMKLLRRQTYPSGSNIICESFCILINCIIMCFCTYVCCVSSRGMRFELVSPVFCGNVETCLLPYVDTGLCPFGWLRNTRYPTEACHHLPCDWPLSITDRQGTFAGSSEIREGKYPSIHSVLSREPNWNSFSICCCGYYFLVWSSFCLVFVINTRMELLMFHLTVCFEITFLEVLLFRVKTLLAMHILLGGWSRNWVKREASCGLSLWLVYLCGMIWNPFGRKVFLVSPELPQYLKFHH